MCPDPDLSGLPPELTLVDRSLLNLGEGWFGRQVVLSAPDGRRLELTVGADPLDALEDLDFDHATVERPARTYRASTTPLVEGLVAVSWQEPGAPEPCQRSTLVTGGFDAEELLAMADRIA